MFAWHEMRAADSPHRDVSEKLTYGCRTCGGGEERRGLNHSRQIERILACLDMPSPSPGIVPGVRTALLVANFMTNPPTLKQRNRQNENSDALVAPRTGYSHGHEGETLEHTVREVRSAL